MEQKSTENAPDLCKYQLKSTSEAIHRAKECAENGGYRRYNRIRGTRRTNTPKGKVKETLEVKLKLRLPASSRGRE